MKKTLFYFVALLIFSHNSILSADAYKSLNIDFLKPQKTPQKTPQSNERLNKKSFINAVKGYNKIEGLFNIYINENKKHALLEIKPDQFDKEYLASYTRESGDAYNFDGSSMLEEYVFIFKQIGEKVHFIRKNVKFRSDLDSAFQKAIDNHVSNSIVSTSKIKSNPHHITKSILIDLKDIYVRDIENLSERSNGRFRFQKDNSFFTTIKSFPYNTEAEVELHFTSKNPQYVYTLPDSRSLSIKYHISFSKIVDTDYRPRLADDRLGYFLTMHQDYSNIYEEDAYTRYINRWDLRKKNPNRRVSDPIKPIVYWIENTVPKDLRSAVREGILAWNSAFEKAGISNAIVVKQMPDDANWDPADVRYNTIRWIFQPGSGYAVGPSRANPYTGELFDADIRISADFIRSFFNEFEEFVVPSTEQTFSDFIKEEDDIKNWDLHDHSVEQCSYQSHLAHQMVLGWNLLSGSNLIDASSKISLKEYVHAGLVDLVLHEVGHTLGLRHNFKASSIYTVSQLSDPEFTYKNGISGSVMDYHPVNMFNGKVFFQTSPGVYDDWAIMYGYSNFDNKDESKSLNLIASQSTNPLLKYATDEDTYGLSTKGIDPHSNIWDLSSDPIAYYDNQIKLVHSLWDKIIEKYSIDGGKYNKLRRVFGQGIREYYSAARNTSKFIGGVYHSRHHIGDSETLNPFTPVDAEDQRKALRFISKNIFSEKAFQFDPELLNKLAPERLPDFRGSVWRMSRLDYPLHNVINYIQSGALYRILDPRILLRVQDNELRVNSGEDKFTMVELFNEINSAIWKELSSGKNINSFRRNLQKNHVEALITILINKDQSFSHDAQSLSRHHINRLYLKIKSLLETEQYDQYTYAHLKECVNLMYSAYNAQTVIN